MNERILVKERKNIPPNCIHIYPGKKVGIGVSRSFTEWLDKLGYMKLRRREDQKYDHYDFPVHLSVLGDELMMSIYCLEAKESGNCTLHNFMIVHIPRDLADGLRGRFEHKVRLEMKGELELIPYRNPRVIHLRFNLARAEVISKLLFDAREVFA